MLFTTIAAGLLAALPIVSAGPPNWGGWGGPPPKNCLSASSVKALIDGYTYLLVNPGGPDFNATALSILTEDFQVFSDSILYLSGRPLVDNSPAYPSRAAFIAGQAQTPPLPVFKTLDYFYDCPDQKIGWRWQASGIGSNKLRVNGLIDIDLRGGLIKTVYSEFNTAAFLVDLGVAACVPPSR